MCERLIEGRRQINVFNYDWKYFYTISFITALCILCFIASFRADIIGADHINYIYEYKNINKIMSEEREKSLNNMIKLALESALTTL